MRTDDGHHGKDYISWGFGLFLIVCFLAVSWVALLDSRLLIRIWLLFGGVKGQAVVVRLHMEERSTATGRYSSKTWVPVMELKITDAGGKEHLVKHDASEDFYRKMLDLREKWFAGAAGDRPWHRVEVMYLPSNPTVAFPVEDRAINLLSLFMSMGLAAAVYPIGRLFLVKRHSH